MYKRVPADWLVRRIERESISRIRCVLCLSFAIACVSVVFDPAFADWENLAPGLDLGRFDTGVESVAGDGVVTVVRIDPKKWDLGLYCTSELDGKNRFNTKAWCDKYDLVAAINAGMFATNSRTHVGFLKDGDHFNNDHVNTKYQSVAAFSPKTDDMPPFRIFDLDVEGTVIDNINEGYDCVIQNLRLIKRPCENRWSRQDKIWSEAALGEDSEGRALFVFCRSPYAMHDFNMILCSLPIGLVCAQHLEGGPEAQLYVRYGDLELDLVGSYETGFLEMDSNQGRRGIPNVIGVKARDSE
jgi:hypothetical protein